jgi:DNA polymerase III delta prime subunit
MNSKLVWTEKYRPQTLNDIFSQDKNISLLNSKKFQKNIPHLLFSGPPGCGKTSTIFAFVRDIYGENYQNNIIEFNSFHERGINMIREKIKYFAKQIGNSSKWKIIILDEADTITQDSQFALRRIMEQYSKNTRFCIICNYINKIIEPIISRCSHFIFNNIPNENIKKYLQYIIQCEQININDIIIDNYFFD